MNLQDPIRPHKSRRRPAPQAGETKNDPIAARNQTSRSWMPDWCGTSGFLFGVRCSPRRPYSRGNPLFRWSGSPSMPPHTSRSRAFAQEGRPAQSLCESLAVPT